MANTLLLKFEAPLQAWGERSNWDRRDTSDYPTKSGVVGLLGCALGISNGRELSELSRKVEVGVRVDRQGRRLRDYQTIGAGYGKRMILTAEGKLKGSPNAPYNAVVEKYYLADAVFTVAVCGDDELIAELGKAVQSPRWPVYLGRKCCVPSRPVFNGFGDFDDVIEALGGKREGDILAPCGPEEQGAFRRWDEVAHTKGVRSWNARYVKVV